ncbi:MAG: hypothetical protein ACYDB7_04445 [Mycobacteriales bacterium]
MVDLVSRCGVDSEQWQERVPNDRSHPRAYQRCLTGGQPVDEIGGGALGAGDWFVAERASW